MLSKYFGEQFGPVADSTTGAETGGEQRETARKINKFKLTLHEYDKDTRRPGEAHAIEFTEWELPPALQDALGPLGSKKVLDKQSGREVEKMRKWKLVHAAPADSPTPGKNVHGFDEKPRITSDGWYGLEEVIETAGGKKNRYVIRRDVYLVERNTKTAPRRFPFQHCIKGAGSFNGMATQGLPWDRAAKEPDFNFDFDQTDRKNSDEYYRLMERLAATLAEVPAGWHGKTEAEMAEVGKRMEEKWNYYERKKEEAKRANDLQAQRDRESLDAKFSALVEYCSSRIPLPTEKIEIEGVQAQADQPKVCFVHIDPQIGANINFVQEVAFSVGSATKSQKFEFAQQKGWEGIKVDRTDYKAESGNLDVQFGMGKLSWSMIPKVEYEAKPEQPRIHEEKVREYGSPSGGVVEFHRDVTLKSIQQTVRAQTPAGEAVVVRELYRNPFYSGKMGTATGGFDIQTMIAEIDAHALREIGVGGKMPEVEPPEIKTTRYKTQSWEYESPDGALRTAGGETYINGQIDIKIKDCPFFESYLSMEDALDRPTLETQLREKVALKIRSWRLRDETQAEEWGEKVITHVLEKLPQFPVMDDLWVVEAGLGNLSEQTETKVGHIPHGSIIIPYSEAQKKKSSYDAMLVTRAETVVHEADAKSWDLPGWKLEQPTPAYFPEGQHVREWETAKHIEVRAEGQWHDGHRFWAEVKHHGDQAYDIIANGVPAVEVETTGNMRTDEAKDPVYHNITVQHKFYESADWAAPDGQVPEGRYLVQVVVPSSGRWRDRWHLKVLADETRKYNEAPVDNSATENPNKQYFPDYVSPESWRMDGAKTIDEFQIGDAKVSSDTVFVVLGRTSGYGHEIRLAKADPEKNITEGDINAILKRFATAEEGKDWDNLTYHFKQRGILADDLRAWLIEAAKAYKLVDHAESVALSCEEDGGVHPVVTIHKKHETGITPPYSIDIDPRVPAEQQIDKEGNALEAGEDAGGRHEFADICVRQSRLMSRYPTAESALYGGGKLRQGNEVGEIAFIQVSSGRGQEFYVVRPDGTLDQPSFNYSKEYRYYSRDFKAPKQWIEKIKSDNRVPKDIRNNITADTAAKPNESLHDHLLNTRTKRAYLKLCDEMIGEDKYYELLEKVAAIEGVDGEDAQRIARFICDRFEREMVVRRITERSVAQQILDKVSAPEFIKKYI